MVKLIECPRDAMQGWKNFIPTKSKIAYLNTLLQVGFDTLDFGSFVSPEVIPQMADTGEVIHQLAYQSSATKLLAIVVNEHGAEEAMRYDAITYLGYPFSISETFQLRNTNKTIAESFQIVQYVQSLCEAHGKQLVLYISMGFGNPYGDPYDKDVVSEWVDRFTALNISVISLADTVGVADPETIAYLFSHLIPAFSAVEFGAHFHSAQDNWENKIEAAFDQGCRRFDSAISGIGGCPMANDELVGNMATENLLYFLKKRKVPVSIDEEAFKKAQNKVAEIFV